MPEEIVIGNWRPCSKRSLVGFFSAKLPSGMVLHDLMLHERNGSRWISFPAREWVNGGGEKKYVRLVEFTDRATADRFRDAVLSSLDRHLGELL